MAVTVEELQIVIVADVANAVKQFQTLNRAIKKSVGDITKPVQQQTQAVQETVSRTMTAAAQATTKAAAASNRVLERQREKVERVKQTTEELNALVQKAMAQMSQPIETMSGALGEPEHYTNVYANKKSAQPQQENAPPAIKLSAWNRVIAQIDAKLDAVKKKLHEIGAYGKDEGERAASAWKNALGAVATTAGGMAQRVRSAVGSIPVLAKSAAARSVSAFSTVSKGILGAVRNMNVFAKLSDSLNDKFKHLGRTIKSALVFSVIYKGLATVREQVGAYLTVNSEFTAALGRLSGVFLTAFQPIYDFVVPALVTLMNLLSSVVAAISQFTAVLFGTTAKQAQSNAKALNQQANALKATGGAADDAAGSLAGFDELNVIGKESAGGGGGAAAAVTPDFGFDYEDTAFKTWGEAFDAFLNNILENGIPKLRTGLLNFADWLNSFSAKLYEMFTFPGVKEKVIRLGQDLANAFNDMVNEINWYQLGQALGAGLNLAILLLVNFIYTFDWMNLGEKLAEAFNGIVSEIDWYAFGQLLWAGWKIAFETLAGFILGLNMPALAQAASNIAIGFFNSISETIAKIDWSLIGSQIAAFLNEIQWIDVLKSTFKAIGDALWAIFDMVAGFIREASPLLLTAIALGIASVFAGVPALVIAGIVTAASLIWSKMDEITAYFIEHMEECGGDLITGLLWGILDALIGIGTWIKEHIFDPIVNVVKNLFGIHSPSTVFAEIGVNLILGLLQGITQKWTEIVGFFAGAASDLEAFFSRAWDSIRQIASEKWNAIKTGVVEPIGERFRTLWDGLPQGAQAAWTGIKNAFSGALSWFDSNVITPIKNKFNAAWNSIKSTASAAFGSVSVKTTKTTTSRASGVPQLASGGVLTRSSLVNVAEYAGASTNPEIVSPQSVMRETFIDAVWPLIDAFLEGSDKVVQAVENKDMNAYLDGKKVSQQLVKPMRQLARQSGKDLLGM